MAYAQVVAASSSNVNVTSPASAVFDGVTVSAGQRTLLTNQTTSSENGVWIFHGTGGTHPMTRPVAPDQYQTTNVFDNATQIWVTKGTTLAGTVWGLDPAAVVAVDTTGHTLTRVALPPVQARVASEGINYALGSTFTSIDGVSTGSTPPLQGNGLAGSDIVLLKDQTTASENGLYWVNTGGALTGHRCSEPLTATRHILVSEGTRNSHTRFDLVTQGAITPDTTALRFSPQNLVFNVCDFGAKGDCLNDNLASGTNDTPAVQAAQDAMVNGSYIYTTVRSAKLYFPPLAPGYSYKLAGYDPADPMRRQEHYSALDLECSLDVHGVGGMEGQATKITLGAGLSIQTHHNESAPNGGDAAGAVIRNIEVHAHPPTGLTAWSNNGGMGKVFSVGDAMSLVQDFRFWYECIWAGTGSTGSEPNLATLTAAPDRSVAWVAGLQNIRAGTVVLILPRSVDSLFTLPSSLYPSFD